MDLHIHTKYSGHSTLSTQQVAKIARDKKLDWVAITDHNEVRGAHELAKLFPTIIGEEISADEGDIIGLFLTEQVNRGSALEVIDVIRGQGGLVMIPHPFDSLRSEAVMSEDICLKADIIEAFNSRVVRASDNKRALEFAREHGIASSVGSDAHTKTEIGRAWMELEQFDDAKSFLRSLATATMHTSRSPIYVHLHTKILKATAGMR